MKSYAVRRKPGRSRAQLALKIAAAIAGLAVVGFGAWWLLTSSTFAVARVESGSYRFTSQADLESALGDFLGRNIWTLSTEEISDCLADLPWIRDLRVRRSLPNTIEVDFREWRPLWQVSDTKRLQVVIHYIHRDRIVDIGERVYVANHPVKASQCANCCIAIAGSDGIACLCLILHDFIEFSIETMITYAGRAHR